MPNSKRISLCGSESTKRAFVGAFPTVEHFLTSDEKALDNQGMSGEDQDLVQQAPLQYLREEVLPGTVSGLDLFHSDVLVSTGCSGIDAVLDGGLRGGGLTELTGASATGKTQICHMASATVARNPIGGRAIYIDTSNSFSVDRLTQFFPSGQPMDSLLCNVTVVRMHSIYHVLAYVEKLGMEMSQVSDRSMCPSLIVLDSASSVISPILGGGGNQKQGHTLMVALGRALKLLALTNSISILCTNHEVGGPGETRPAMGEQWTNQVTVRVQLTKTDDNVRKATIIKAGDALIGTSHIFRLDSSHL